MSESTTTTTTTSTPNAAGLAALEAAVLANATQPALPELVQGQEQELTVYQAEFAVEFHTTNGYRPRCAAELDAYCNSSDEWAAYQLANPAPKPGQGEQPLTQAQTDGAMAQLLAKQAEQHAALAAQALDAQKAADQTLDSLVKAYRKGEAAYSLGLLQTGELCLEYIVHKAHLGHSRKSAVQTIEGRLAQYASEAVDVSRMVRTWAAYALLGDASGYNQPTPNAKGELKGRPLADEVPYGHYRMGWSLLIQSAHQGTAEEHYILTPSTATDAIALYKQATDSRMGRDDVVAKCQALVRAGLARDKQATAAADLAQKQATDKANEEARLARVNRQRELDEEARLIKLARDAKDAAARDAANAQLASQTQAREEAQREEAHKQAIAEAAERQRVATEKAAKDAQTAKDRDDAKSAKAAKDKADRETAKGQPKPADPTKAGESRGVNILAQLAQTAKAGNHKDVASMLATPVHKADDMPALAYELALALAKVPSTNPDAGPDDLVLAMLRGFADSPEVGGVSKRALRVAIAALTVPANKPSPSPVDVANTLTVNATLVGNVA